MTDVTAVRPGRLLDVVSGELLTERAVLVDGERIAAVVAAHDAPADVRVLDLPELTRCCPAWSTATPTWSARGQRPGLHRAADADRRAGGA